MSEIAKALANAAKITEAGHLQRAHKKSAEATRKNHTREFIWAGVLSCVCLIVVVAFLAHAADTDQPTLASPRALTIAEVPPAPESITPKRPSPELESELANVVIKALIKSPNPRVLIGNRVIELGDELIPGLILSGIDAQELIATDVQGLTYRKKI